MFVVCSSFVQILTSLTSTRKDGNPHTYSHTVTDENKTANQKSSGRCWLFAYLNVVRRDIIKTHSLAPDFELSQTHLFFWDKVERCNYFLEQVIDTLDTPTDDRLLHHLLADPINDGGQWDMIVNLVNKYGLVPKEVYPEAWSSTASRKMNALLKAKLREFASVLRTQGSPDDTSFAAVAARGNAARELKEGMMEELFRIITVHLGAPVESFDWKAVSKDKKTFTRHENLTPASFVDQFVTFDVNDYVSVINDPRNAYDALYTVDRLGNVVGGLPVRYINTDAETLKALVVDQIKADRPVWFGCDVGKEFHRADGLLSMDVFDYSAIDTGLHMDKATRVTYGQSLMTHAMVFTGVDDKTGALRVENSWGSKDRAAEGYLSMSAAWFDEYTFQIVVPKSALPENLAATLSLDPVVLPPWDPMGALACSSDNCCLSHADS